MPPIVRRPSSPVINRIVDTDASKTGTWTCSALNTVVFRVVFRVTTAAGRASDRRDGDRKGDGEHDGEVDGRGDSGTSSGFFDICRLWRNLCAHR